MRRKLTSNRKEMKGGAWFDYSLNEGAEFNIESCHSNKVGKRYQKDYDIFKKILKDKDELSFAKSIKDDNMEAFKKYRKPPSKDSVSENGMKGIYIPISKDKNDVYVGRKIFHKYYGEGKIEHYEPYKMGKSGGYGYYIRFEEPKIKDYVYTFATKNIPSLINTILIETFPIEMIFAVYFKHIKDSEVMNKDGEERAVAMRHSLEQLPLGEKIKEKFLNTYDTIGDEKKRELHTKYNKTFSAGKAFFNLGNVGLDFDKLIENMKRLRKGSSLSDRTYILTWGVTYLGLPEEIIQRSEINEEYIESLMSTIKPQFPDDLKAAREKAIEVAPDDKKLQNTLVTIWKMFKPNSKIDTGAGRGGGIGTTILKLLFFPVVLMFMLCVCSIIVILGLIVVSIAVVGIPLWTIFGLLYGSYKWFSNWDGGGRRSNKKTKRPRETSRRVKSRRKKASRRKRY